MTEPTVTTTEPLVGRPFPDAAREVAAAAAEWRQVGERINGLLERVERLLPRLERLQPVIGTSVNAMLVADATRQPGRKYVTGAYGELIDVTTAADMVGGPVDTMLAGTGDEEQLVRLRHRGHEAPRIRLGEGDEP